VAFCVARLILELLGNVAPAASGYFASAIRKQNGWSHR
jgi:hypothetical protein